MHPKKLVLALVLVAGTAMAAAPVMPRHPAPSPDAGTIAFSWQGDIWIAPTGGWTAQRVTANPGYDHHPVWLPDGQRLAFVSSREGGDDVYHPGPPAGAVAPPHLPRGRRHRHGCAGRRPRVRVAAPRVTRPDAGRLPHPPDRGDRVAGVPHPGRRGRAVAGRRSIWRWCAAARPRSAGTTAAPPTATCGWSRWPPARWSG